MRSTFISLRDLVESKYLPILVIRSSEDMLVATPTPLWLEQMVQKILPMVTADARLSDLQIDS